MEQIKMLSVNDDGYKMPETVSTPPQTKMLGVNDPEYKGPIGYEDQIRMKLERVKSITDQMEDPVRELENVFTADYIAQMIGESTAHIYANLDTYGPAYFQQTELPKTAWHSAVDEFTRGMKTIELSKLGMEMMMDPDDETLYEDYFQLLSELPDPDMEDRNILEKILIGSGSIMPSMGYVLGNGLLTGGAGALVGGTAGYLLTGPGGAALGAKKGFNIGRKLGVGKESFALAGGAIFSEVMMLEVPGTDLRLFELYRDSSPGERAQIISLARAAAATGGVVSAITEVGFDTFARVTGASKGVVGEAAERVMQQILKGGYVTSAVGRALTHYGANVTEETLQEILQELAEKGAEEAAKYYINKAQDLGFEMAPTQEWIDELKEVGSQTVFGMMGIGLPGAIINTYREGSTALSERQQNVPRGYRQSGTSQGIPITDIIPSRYTQEEYTQAKEVYDPSRWKRTKAPIKVYVDDNGSMVAVDGAAFQIALENGERAVEVEIVENPKSQIPEQEASPEWAMNSSEFMATRQKQARAVEEYRVANTLADFRYNLIQAFPQATDQEREGMSWLVELGASVQGLTVDQYIQETFDTTAFTRGVIPDGTNKAGVSFQENGKALIHLTEQSDFSSFVHEYGHIVRTQLPLADQELLLKHYGEKDWKIKDKSNPWDSAEEKFARAFETYFHTGQAPDPELEGLFRRISQALQKVYGAIMKAGYDLEAPVKEILDRFFTSQGPSLEKENLPAYAAQENDIIFQPYESLPEGKKTLADRYIDMIPGLREKLERFKGTPYEKLTVETATFWGAIEHVSDGMSVDAVIERYGDISPQAEETFRSIFSVIASEGKDGIWDYIVQKGLLGGARKPGTSVNGLFTDCNPSMDCAKFCYACRGNYNYTQVMTKQELVGYVVKTYPEKAADRIASEYKLKYPTSWQNRPLRLFDRGDISEEWLPVIERLNEKGISTHIFSKRPEILSQVDQKKNVALVSIDSSNIELARAYPDLRIAYVYESENDLEYIAEFKKQVQVILPIRSHSQLMSQGQIDHLSSVLKEEGLSQKMCPVDSGKRALTEGICASCLAGKGLGCYNNNKPVAVESEVNLPDFIQKVTAKRSELSEDEKRRFDEALRNLLDRSSEGRSQEEIDSRRALFEHDAQGEGDPHSQPEVAPDTLYQSLEQDDDGVVFSAHEEGYDYEGEERKNLQEEIQLQLEFYSESDPLSGRSSRVQTQFKETKRVDFTGLQVTGARDVAEAFSVYRNPYTEYFHIVYTKGDKIISHNAMSSGLPGTTIAFDSRRLVKSLYRMDRRMDRLGADGYYLIHNHPSGSPSPSQQDISVTENYRRNIRGYKGHIILDHGTYGFIDELGTASEQKYIPRKTYDDLSDEEPFTSPDKVASYVKAAMGDDVRTAYFFLNTQNQVIGFEPIIKVSHQSAYQKMRHNQAAHVIFATSDRQKYETLVKEDMGIQNQIGQERRHDVFLDIIYLNEFNSFRSAMEEGKHRIGTWEQYASHEVPFGYLWEESALYQPSDEHEAIIRNAVEEYKPVPQEILEEYQDREWAAQEIKRREVLQSFEWLSEMAVGVDTWEELKDDIQGFAVAMLTEEQIDALRSIGEGEDRFYQEIWSRANLKTREDSNAQFIKDYANEEGVLAIAQEIASDTKQWGGSGMTGPLFVLAATLRAKNTHGTQPKHIKAAISSVRNNPSRIRQALAVVQNDQVELIQLEYEEQIAEATPYGVQVRKLTDEERMTEAMKTSDPEIKEMLLSGIGTDQESLNRLTSEMNKKIAALKTQQTKIIKDLQEKLGWEKSRVLSLKESLKETINEAEAAKKTAEVEKLKKAWETRKEISDRERKRREILRLKERMRILGNSIERKPSVELCHVDYQREILDLQKLIDGSFRRKGRAEEWFERNQFYKENPDALKALSPEDIDKITKKPLNYWTMPELEELNRKINLLRDQGRRKLEELEAERDRRVRALSSKMALELGGGTFRPGPNVPKNSDAYKEWLKTSKKNELFLGTWRPSRIFKVMGGEDSALVKYFWRNLNRAMDNELKMKLQRIEAGKAKMKELGIDDKYLAQRVPGRDGEITVNEAIHLYIAQNNEMNMKAIVYGTGILHPEDYIVQLESKDRALGDFISKDFEDNFDRYAKAYAADKNEILYRVQGGYFPMRRMELLDERRNEEIVKDLATSAGAQKGYAARHGTHSRIEISEEHQKPIRMGAVDLWFQEIEEQEHYIESARYIKEMHRILKEPIFQTSMVNAYGKRGLKWLEKYINEFANPTLYKFYDATSNVSKMLRGNMAVAYLSFNMLTIAKQLPSVGLFLGRVGPHRLAAGAAKFMKNPIKMLEFVNERDPQMKERSMNRALEELKLQQDNPWMRAVQKVGKVGMAPITWVDKMATTIGWLAVYDANILKGEEEAIRLAQEAVLETQPAARAKDLAEIYRSSEGLNWFLMFSNQINQTWNILTADIPQAVKQMQFLQAMGMVTGLMMSFGGIALLSGWKPWEKDDPEEFVKSSMAQLLKSTANTVPVIGKTFVSGFDGWMGVGVDPVPAAYEIGRLSKVAADWDGDKAVKQIGKVAESLAVVGGVPIMPMKRTVKTGEAISDEEYEEAIKAFFGIK